MSVDEALAADRAHFEAHPEQDAYIREFVPGEFGKAELPQIPDGFRFATHVSVKMRQEGKPVGSGGNLRDGGGRSGAPPPQRRPE
jgi:hypothetical protein